MIKKKYKDWVASLIGQEHFLTIGTEEIDFYINKYSVTNGYKIKQHFQSTSIVYDVFCLQQYKLIDLFSSNSDFWVDLLETEIYVTAYINRTHNLLLKVKSLIKTGDAELFIDDKKVKVLVKIYDFRRITKEIKKEFKEVL